MRERERGEMRERRYKQSAISYCMYMLIQKHAF